MLMRMQNRKDASFRQERTVEDRTDVWDSTFLSYVSNLCYHTRTLTGEYLVSELERTLLI